MDEEFVNNFIQQIKDLWLNPEIVRRDFKEQVYALFVIIKPDKTEIQLNNETTFTLGLQTTNDMPLPEAGKKMTLDDLSKYAISLHIPQEIFDNYGYIAAIILNEKWTIRFDFMRSRGTAKDKLNLAEDFLRAAEAAKIDRIRSYNMFQAVEQVMQAALIKLAHLDGKTHSRTSSLANQHTKLGNIPKEVTQLFNRLLQDRDKIYSNSSVSFPITDEHFILVRNLIEAYRHSFEH